MPFESGIGVDCKSVVGVGFVLALAVAAHLRGYMIGIAQRFNSGVNLGVELNGSAVVCEFYIIGGETAAEDVDSSTFDDAAEEEDEASLADDDSFEPQPARETAEVSARAAAVK